MLSKWNRHLVLLIALLPFSGMAEEFDRGGLSFDFQKISDARFKNKKENLSENLVADFDSLSEKSGLPGKWSHDTWVHLDDAALAKKLEPQARKLVFYEIADLDGVKAAYIRKPLELEGVCADKTVNVSGNWRQIVKLPDTSGGIYNIAFKYKGSVFGNFATNCYLLMYFKDNSGNTPSNGKETTALKMIRFPNPQKDWQNFNYEIGIPAGTAWVELFFRIDGTGEIYFSNISMRKINQEMPFAMTLAPMAFMDNKFCLSSNDPAVMAFAWRKNQSADKIELQKPVLCIELPEAVQVKAARDGLKLISSEAELIGGIPYRLYKIDLSSVRKRPYQREEYDEYLVHSILVFTSEAPGSRLPKAFYWLSDGEKQLSNKESFSIDVIPQIKLSAKPEIFMNGFYIGGSNMNFSGKENKELLGRFVGAGGNAWIVGRPDTEMTGIYRKNGIKIITPELYYIANGYRIGEPNKEKPDYAKFVPIGKCKNKDTLRATCPVAIYTESEYFKNSVIPYLKKNLEGFDGLWANWEPYMYIGMGCFCDRCRDEFVKFSKLPPEEVKTAWPNEMMIGKKYYDICAKFRSYQHALMIKTIEKAVNSVTTGKVGFVPGIAWMIMTDSTHGRDYCKEHDPLDYAASFKYIDPWGPYPCWPSLRPYSYARGANLGTFAAARKVREFTDKNFTAKSKPELLAFPHGIQDYDFWVTQPEAISMDTISFFLNRFRASCTYNFPRGYDNRFWAAQAEASRIIAEYEKYVFNGNTSNGFSVLPLSPYPAPAKKLLQKYFPDMPPVDMLQALGFKLGEKYLAAIGNFWEKGDVFFRLSAKGLDKKIRYVLRQPDKKRYFANEKTDSFSADELETGITLHAGALRWAFFLIEPFNEKMDYGRKITQSDVVGAMKRHLPEISKAAAIEKQADDAEEAENKKSELKALSSGKLSCLPLDGPGGEQQLKFNSGDNELLLSLNGMIVKSWKINKNEFVSSDQKLGFGFPAFWHPPAKFILPYHVKKLEALPSGITIIAERTLNVRDSAALEYLTIRQKIEIACDCASVKFETELLNATSAETGPRDITAGFRYHNMPLCLGSGGCIVMVNNKQKVVFNRKFERILFAMSPVTSSAIQVKKLFEIVIPEVEITAPEAVFISKDGKLSVRMLPGPEQSFAGFACWDTPDLRASTFEPFFNLVTIKSGQSLKYSMSLEIKK